jgi:hypothetical protein
MTQATITESDLEQFNGTLDYHKHLFGGYYTDGVHFLAMKAKAYWLVDAVFSWLTKPAVRREEFQVWTLERKAGDAESGYNATLTAEDGNGMRIARQHIWYTDFPLASVKLYLERGSVDGITPAWVLMLPGER